MISRKSLTWPVDSRGLLRRRIRAQPGEDLGKAEGVSLIKAGNESVCRRTVGCDLNSVYAEKRIHRGKRGALVAVNEKMILSKAFPQRRGFLERIGVITRLRAE